jgi:hypothetical protein
MRTISLAAVVCLLSVSALAQPAPPLAGGPPPPPPPVLPVPIPQNGCLWAGRAFSDGAEFCWAPSTGLKCTAGKWESVGVVPCNTTIDTK